MHGSMVPATLSAIFQGTTMLELQCESSEVTQKGNEVRNIPPILAGTAEA